MNKKDIIENIKKGYLDDDSLDKLKDIKEKYDDKSEEEVIVEIIQLNSNIKESMSDDEYDSMLEKLENIRHLLSDEQSKKLDSVLNIINKKDES